MDAGRKRSHSNPSFPKNANSLLQVTGKILRCQHIQSISLYNTWGSAETVGHSLPLSEQALFQKPLGDIWVITYFCCEIKARKGGRANKGRYLEGVTKPSLRILLYDTNKC